MVIRQNTTAYVIFVEVHAAHTGKTEAQVQAEITPDQFEERLRTLHQQYMAEAFSIGKLADLLGVPPLNLYDILNELELPTNR